MSDQQTIEQLQTRLRQAEDDAHGARQVADEALRIARESQAARRTKPYPTTAPTPRRPPVTGHGASRSQEGTFGAEARADMPYVEQLIQSIIKTLSDTYKGQQRAKMEDGGLAKEKAESAKRRDRRLQDDARALRKV